MITIFTALIRSSGVQVLTTSLLSLLLLLLLTRQRLQQSLTKRCRSTL